MLEQFGIALRKTLPATENPDVVDSFVDAEVRANVTYGHYSHQIAYAASETPSRHCQVLRIRHFVRPCGFVCVRFFFSCVCTGCRPTSFPSKGEKEKVKKKRKREREEKKVFFFFSSERARTSFLFQSTMRRQVLGQPVGMNERENLGLPAFSTKSACSRVEVTPPPLFFPSSPHARAATRAAVLCSSPFRE